MEILIDAKIVKNNENTIIFSNDDTFYFSNCCDESLEFDGTNLQIEVRANYILSNEYGRNNGYTDFQIIINKTTGELMIKEHDLCDYLSSVAGKENAKEILSFWLKSSAFKSFITEWIDECKKHKYDYSSADFKEILKALKNILNLSKDTILKSQIIFIKETQKKVKNHHIKSKTQ
ncbi:hypothetical protein SAMN05880501_11690 [Ureibacillus xyleni]|uniref:Uncharacterized protein n=1 Tax=Ureibacillus xyleni TaxID=614648 RepID=A0A285TN82_9BACL|nr:hypothetical protein [Ureibacillus xyleni]SOC24087.1 hypothetical protein SAMN05880501_11690 [Ureibacillus xyleni]